jgi:hypothetical protein
MVAFSDHNANCFLNSHTYSLNHAHGLHYSVTLICCHKIAFMVCFVDAVGICYGHAFANGHHHTFAFSFDHGNFVSFIDCHQIAFSVGFVDAIGFFYSHAFAHGHSVVIALVVHDIDPISFYGSLPFTNAHLYALSILHTVTDTLPDKNAYIDAFAHPHCHAFAHAISVFLHDTHGIHHADCVAFLNDLSVAHAVHDIDAIGLSHGHTFGHAHSYSHLVSSSTIALALVVALGVGVASVSRRGLGLHGGASQRVL